MDLSYSKLYFYSYEIVHVEATTQQNSREDQYPDFTGEIARQSFEAVRMEMRGNGSQDVRGCSFQ